MRFGSVCSGIEAASAAWHPLGWEAAWFSEIEPFPCAVLAHHYPEVPNHGDMTALPELIRSGEVEAPDLFCGGTPCQAFSVAGLRRSLDDARGNLSLTFCEIADAIDAVRRAGGKPASIVFWENVPGVLSTSDNAFGCFLGALAGCDTAIEPLAATGWTDAGVVAGPIRSVAWRVLDAQYFGLAQRRRRVFVVASAREGFDPAAVLFEWEGLRRDTAPSREAGQRATGSLTARAGRNLGQANDDVDGHKLITMAHGQGGAEIGFDRGPTLTCNHEAPILAHSLRGEGFDASEDGTGRGTPLVPVQPYTLAIRGRGDSHNLEYRQDGTANALLTPNGGRGGIGVGAIAQPVGVTLHGTDGTQSVASFTDLSSSLRSRIPSGVENSTTTAVMQPVTYDLFNVTAPVNRQNRQPGDPCHTLARSNAEHAAVVGAIGWDEELNASVEQAGTLLRGGDGGRHDGVAVAWSIMPQNSGRDYKARPVDVLQPLMAAGPQHGNQGGDIIQTAMQVRRLTPVECERLQGFPDGYTAIPWRNKPASECPDGPRYKALGNSRGGAGGALDWRADQRRDSRAEICSADSR